MLTLYLDSFDLLTFAGNLVRTLFSIVTNMFSMCACYFPLPLAGLFMTIFVVALAYKVGKYD